VRKKRVLIVDDSATIRKLLTSIFSESPDLEVVGAVEKPSLVEETILKVHPDVITLDIHMPEMDGVTLLSHLYPKFQIPTVMITSVSKEEGPLVLNALEAGAVDYIQKPTLHELPIMAPQILEKVKIAAHSKRRKIVRAASAVPSLSQSSVTLDHRRIIAIGSSTGGTEALKEILIRMPKSIPPIVVVQHIPPVFSAALAKRLDDLCPFAVKEAEDGDILIPNQVLIAPGGKQMKVKQTGSEYLIQITD
jgi:two-component system chemotaxis response regulator CheB